METRLGMQRCVHYVQFILVRGLDDAVLRKYLHKTTHDLPIEGQRLSVKLPGQVHRATKVQRFRKDGVNAVRFTSR